MPYEYPQPPKPPKPSLPRPALGNPSLERATDALRKLYPNDMRGVSIEPDWSGPGMISNRAGFVSPSNPNTIKVGALRSAMMPQELIEATAAHELEHVRQFRDPEKRQQMRAGMSMPYEQRQHELDAQDASQRYRAQRGGTPYDGFIPAVQEGVVEQNATSPAVQELLKLINSQR